jgi:hypothetical protein
MKEFNLRLIKLNLLWVLFLGFFLGLFFVGCESSSSTNENVCPQCNMPVPNSKEQSSHLDNKVYFDDMGCLILWTKKESKEPSRAMVFTKDTKKYIKATDAHYTINERTPMGYGFTAYEKEQPKSIEFEEMKLRMLRGEHMANPKIRKQILGE